MAANGRLPDSSLTAVQGTMRLEKKTAVAFLALKAAAKKELGRVISVAPPGGAYRDWLCQDEMHRASLGNEVLARKWNLNPHSSVKVAAAGGSSHGWGTRVDIVGTAMDAAFLALAARFGFTREFGGSDPNHFMFDGRTIKTSVVAKVVAKVTPKRPVTYVVKSGDTAGVIAKRYGISLQRFADFNPSIKNLNVVKINQKVRVG